MAACIDLKNVSMICRWSTLTYAKQEAPGFSGTVDQYHNAAYNIVVKVNEERGAAHGLYCGT